MKTADQVLNDGSKTAAQNQYAHGAQNLSEPPPTPRPHDPEPLIDAQRERYECLQADAHLHGCELRGITVLGYIVAVVDVHLLPLAALARAVKTPRERVAFVQALAIADSIAGIHLEREDPRKCPLTFTLPNWVCMPGLVNHAALNFMDALFLISQQLYKNFPAIAALARAHADPFEAAQIAQALYAAQSVFIDTGIEDKWQHPAEDLYVEQLARWASKWASDPHLENVDCRLRYMNSGKTIADILATNREDNGTSTRRPRPIAKPLQPAGKPAPARAKTPTLDEHVRAIRAGKAGR